MSSSLPRILGLALILVTGCRLESHPPPGVPAEEAAIRSAVAAWLARNEPWAQVIRSDVKQDRDLASAWVVTTLPPSEGEGDRVSLFVLRRAASGWTVEFQGRPLTGVR